MGLMFQKRKVEIKGRYGEPDRVEEVNAVNPFGAVILVLLVLFLIGALFIGGCSGIKSYNRYQKRADAKNNVRVTAINIRKAQQQAKIVHAQNAAVQARAEQRKIEAVGIRRAQDEIQATLTPLYVQHEYVQALERIAVSGRNNTTTFIPTGPGGLPQITPQVSASQGR